MPKATGTSVNLSLHIMFGIYSRRWVLTRALLRSTSRLEAALRAPGRTLTLRARMAFVSTSGVTPSSG